MFSYLGGKKFQAKWIADHFPEFDNYVEPFGGAMWVYFQSTVNVKLNVYNDYNEYLVNIFECATRKPGEFLKELNKHKVQDRKLFEQFKKDYLIKSIICFLDHSQREELKDSIDREIF